MEEGVFLQRKGPSLTALLRWSGLALVAGGVLMVVATVLHPSRETPATILEAEVRLVAAHIVFTMSYLLVLLGLPGLYGAASVRMGRLGLIGFLLAFLGTMLIAVSGNFGFLAPVLAAQSPATIDAINRYPPEGALNVVAFGGFVVGFVSFGVAMAKTVGFPRPSGVLVAIGAPCQVVGFALAQLVSPGLWAIAVLGSVALGAGLAWPPNVAASGVLTAIAGADRTNRPRCHQSSSLTAQLSIPLAPECPLPAPQCARAEIIEESGAGHLPMTRSGNQVSVVDPAHASPAGVRPS